MEYKNYIKILLKWAILKGIYIKIKLKIKTTNMIPDLNKMEN